MAAAGPGVGTERGLRVITGELLSCPACKAPPALLGATRYGAHSCCKLLVDLGEVGHRELHSLLKFPTEQVLVWIEQCHERLTAAVSSLKRKTASRVPSKRHYVTHVECSLALERPKQGNVYFILKEVLAKHVST